MPIFDDFLWTKRSPRSERVGPEESRAVHEGGGTPYPLGTPPYLVDDLETSPDVRPTPKIPINTETPRKEPRSGVPPPQASVATKNQSGPCSSTLLEGESITGGHLHHPGAIHDEEGVVHPRGRGYV